jgi:hypothetical protein
MRSYLCLFTVLVAACGEDTSGSSEPLTCESIAICTTYEVKTFTGAVPAPAGGTIKSGLYRLAYNIIPDGIDGEEADYSDELTALLIEGTQYNWAGYFQDSVGKITIAGTDATFTDTRDCFRGADQGDSTNSWTYKFTASGTELHIYDHVRRSDGVEWDKMNVFKLVSDPDEICDTVSSEPSTPGDSAMCNVANCGCSFSVNGTVDACPS